jgi:hypothetical protein
MQYNEHNSKCATGLDSAHSRETPLILHTKRRESLHENPAVKEGKQRLASLTPSTLRAWNVMRAPQMVAHWDAGMEMTI